MEKNCIRCGTTFHKRLRASLKQWENQKHCSIKCSNTQLPVPPKVCEGCGNLFNKTKRIGIEWELRKYCSQKCSIKYRIGEKAAHWKGDGITYGGIHSFMKQNYGKASKCENKNCPGKSINYQWANLSGEYKHDRSDWMELCASCHQFMDRKNLCGRGHELTPENTYMNPKSERRECRICRKAALVRYQERKRLSLSHL